MIGTIALVIIELSLRVKTAWLAQLGNRGFVVADIEQRFMAELHDVNSGGASSSETSNRFGSLQSKKKDLESLHLSPFQAHRPAQPHSTPW
jgi:hypothetical protein